ncbi:MAG: tRNA uridine(34) 5-carboxymethylaminomethyl modification radical SAM/GNAT enzyme Elp3 [Thermoprotei archaeon]|nr:MAG: tRNA uridine(34) 5-carboxymethylaminomethyl modification radical SAM/GNAT enzyme Elp3 [Thermoprotei archaeon]
MSSVLKGIEAKQKFFKGIKKPVRFISGVHVIAVMVKPRQCPHGRCLYCPGGVELGAPQSYVPDSPAVARAIPLKFDPYEQVKYRIRAYEAMGHRVSKVELIVMGGTFLAYPPGYQEWFISMCLKAMNDYPLFREKPEETSLPKEQMRNENAKIRCIGITIETRPDWCKEEHIDRMLYLGATRCELGVQTIYDDILERVERGHSVRDSIEATQLLKDSAYKVCYHLMPGLPGSDVDKDLEMFKTIFRDERFKPDYLKIYPTLVIPSSKLYELWKHGEYKPYSEEDYLELLVKMLSMVPRYVRVIRVGRDIPVKWIAAGLRYGNLRQIVLDRMKERGLKCRCIRCREVGHYILEHAQIPDFRDIVLCRIDYEASRGHEIFLSVEDLKRDILYALLRLRIPSDNPHRREIRVGRSALIRELHVYGPAVPVGEKSFWWQHRGLGKLLMSYAEKIALEEFGRYRIFVISGVGVRNYYRKLGYRKYPLSFYMFKDLRKRPLVKSTLDLPVVKLPEDY